MRHSGSIRFYEDVLTVLANEGHRIRIAVSGYNSLFNEEKVKGVCLGKNIDCYVYSNIPYFWYPLLRIIRKAQDYLRYLCPEYKNADKLKERATSKMPYWLLLVLNLTCRDTKSVWRMIYFLRRIDRAITGPKQIKNALKEFNPDVFLITPLVDFGASQLDWLKSAKELGIRTCLCVGSWDNLTNKGLIQIEPEAVIIWNHHQAVELKELHRLSRSQVFITGAQCFDQWFEAHPQIPKAEFLSKTGLQDKPFLLYLCSSPFICPDEVGFVKEWIKSIRQSPDTELSALGILIRPHPQNSGQWKNVIFNEFKNIAIYPRGGALPVDTSSKNDFFCSMYYAEAVVGINTSAMIEAGILGKPVFTVFSEDFKGTQEGTLHFHYLINGGLLYVATDYTEHLRQLKEVIRNKNRAKEKLRNFIKDFIRPQGLNFPATPLVKEAILKTAVVPVIPFRNNRFVSLVLKLLVAPLAIIVRLKDNQKNKRNKKKMNNPVLYFNIVNAVKRINKHFILFFARKIAANSFVRNRVVPWLITNVKGFYVDESEVLRDTEREIRKAAKSGSPIIIGPWLSEVGFEVLYWIPFLNWAIKEYNITKDRIYIVSRGGAQLWYKNISDNYADIFDYITPEELRKHQEERISMMESQKHLAESEFDKEIIKNVAKTYKLKQYVSLHPLLMYTLFLGFWRRKQPVSLVLKHSQYEQFLPIPKDDFSGKLPDKYIAVKFYFNSSFPKTEENSAFISRLLERLSRKHHIVILESGINIDDHSDCLIKNSGRIHKITDFVTPRSNLDFQTRVLSKAEMFIGTYGGFSYLAAFYGRPAIAIYSREWWFLPVHLDVMNRVSRFLKYGECDKLIKDQDTPRKSQSDFLALDAAKIGILDTLLGGTNDIG